MVFLATPKLGFTFAFTTVFPPLIMCLFPDIAPIAAELNPGAFGPSLFGTPTARSFDRDEVPEEEETASNVATPSEPKWCAKGIGFGFAFALLSSVFPGIVDDGPAVLPFAPPIPDEDEQLKHTGAQFSVCPYFPFLRSLPQSLQRKQSGCQGFFRAVKHVPSIFSWQAEQVFAYRRT